MIWRYCLAVLSAAAICLAIAGCGSVHGTHFYTLGEAGAVAFTGSDTTKPLIRVERLTVAEPYAGRRIVYRPNPNEVSFWEYHRWAAAPGRMLTARVAERMAESGLFRGVDCFPYSWANADLVLRGTVLAFEEIDKGGDWYAHVKMFLELTSRKAGRSTLWSAKIDIEKKAASRHPEAVVVAMSEVLDEAIAKAEEGIAATLR
jgi:ABC-type uncharacterized transport system auxiliary subunit